jgi:type II secretory pathway predicted ATPase ExeA
VIALVRTIRRTGLPSALNNAAIAALIAATTAGKALIDGDCAKNAVTELTRD